MPTIRKAQTDDVPFLADMGWEAVAVAPFMRALGKDAALSRPENRKYFEGWGRPGDAAVVALDDTGQRIGAAWYRRFSATEPGYGFVAFDVPELSIGVAANARGQGVGAALIDALVALARDGGERAISLSVDRHNPAHRLYERHGFRDAGISDPGDSSVTMILVLGPSTA